MLALLCRNAQAGELDALGQDERLASLEAEVDWLRGKLVSDRHQASCCDQGRQSCRSKTGCYAGMGLVFARPHFKESFQYSQINLATGQQSLIPFSYDYDVTPQAWLGYRFSKGLGVNLDYWQYDHAGNRAVAVSDGVNIFSANATTVIFPATILADDPGEVLIADSSLETQILNLLGTMETTVGSVHVRAGIGLRYVLLNQELAYTVVDGFGVPQGLLNWSRKYEGLGPSVKLNARRRFGNSNFSGIAGGSGALLFGSKDLDRFVLGDVGTPPAAPFLRLNDADEVVGSGELRFGLEWARTLCNGTHVALQGTYEGQLWAEAGAPTLGFLGFEGFGISAEIRR